MSILSAILILGVIIVIHELGHFLLAKKNGITVTEFSVGMGPRIASFVKNGTRYSLKLLPIGGSCMMLGEDETVEDEGAFHKKGVWARFSVIFAGAFFNFMLAFILALVVLGAEGVDIPKVTKVEAGSTAEDAGLKVGDRITSFNGSTIHFGREISTSLYFKPISEKAINITYVRDGKKYSASIAPKEVSTLLLGCNFTDQAGPATLAQVWDGFPLAQQGVAKGDTITAINGTKVASGAELHQYLKKNPLTDQPLQITYQSKGVEKTISVTPKLYTEYDPGWDYNMSPVKVSPIKVVLYSFYELKFNIVSTIKSLGALVTGKISAKEISGPVGIVNYVGQIVDETKSYGIGITLLSLAQFSILISANLGVMNLLPIPALDGGRLVFLLIEAVRGKPIAKEREAMVHFIGMAALMVLMVFVMFNDIRNLFG